MAEKSLPEWHHGICVDLEKPSRRRAFQKRELGRCDILFWATADGHVRVSQVIKSTGHARLDAACLRAVSGKKVIPARDKSGPIDGWAIPPMTRGPPR